MKIARIAIVFVLFWSSWVTAQDQAGKYFGRLCSGSILQNKILQFYRASDTTATGLVATDTTDAEGRWDVNLPGTGNYRMYSVTDGFWFDRFSWVEQSAKHGTAVFSDTLFANGVFKSINFRDDGVPTFLRSGAALRIRPTSDPPQGTNMFEIWKADASSQLLITNVGKIRRASANDSSVGIGLDTKSVDSPAIQAVTVGNNANVAIYGAANPSGAQNAFGVLGVYGGAAGASGSGGVQGDAGLNGNFGVYGQAGGANGYGGFFEAGNTANASLFARNNTNNSGGNIFILQSGVTPTQKLLVNNAGWFRIGTGTPSYTLDVSGTGRFTDSLIANGIRFDNRKGFVSHNFPNIGGLRYSPSDSLAGQYEQGTLSLAGMKLRISNPAISKDIEFIWDGSNVIMGSFGQNIISEKPIDLISTGGIVKARIDTSGTIEAFENGLFKATFGTNKQTDSVLVLNNGAVAGGDSVLVNNTRVSGGSLILVTPLAQTVGTLFVKNRGAGRFTIVSNADETGNVPVVYYITKF